MKRSSITAAVLVFAGTLAASPALAQDYYYDDPFGQMFGGLFLLCWGIMLLIGLILFAFNVWMFIDALSRHEYEYPGSTGSSKTLWVVLLGIGFLVGFGWIVAAVYFFTVYRKIKRGSLAPQVGVPHPQAYAPPAPPAPPESPVPPAPPAPPVPPESPVPPAPPESPPKDSA